MATASTSIVLITGANRGIGLETVRQLVADASRHVLLGSQSVETGEEALRTIQSENPKGSVELLQLDVDSYDSVTQAAKKVTPSHSRLDVIINNAAIAHFNDSVPIHERVRQAFQTNCIGPFMVVEAFSPLLKKAIATPRIINVSSGAGSIAARLDPDNALYNTKLTWYITSKAALNMLIADQSVELGKDGIKVFAYTPGFTVSKLSTWNTAEAGAQPTSEGVRL